MDLNKKLYKYYNNKRVLVIGGAGFIGSELSSQIASNCKHLTIIDNLVNGKLANIQKLLSENVKFKKIDIRNYDEINNAMKDIDIVFHLACLGVRHSIHSPRENHDVNASATLEILKIAKNNHIGKFIYISTSEVYGNNVKIPISETHSTFPATVYGAAKLAAEAYCRAYWDTYRSNIVIIRPFNSFGPNSHHEGDCGEVIPKFMLRSFVEKPLIIHGDGNQTRDFSYVSDTARGILLGGINDTAIGKTINIGFGAEVSINQLAALIRDTVCNSNSKIVHSDPRPGDVKQLFSDNTNANSLLNYQPKISLKEGLFLLKEWYNKDSKNIKNLLSEEIEKNWLKS